MGSKQLLPGGPEFREADPLNAKGLHSVASVRPRRDFWTALLLSLICLLVYNANAFEGGEPRLLADRRLTVLPRSVQQGQALSNKVLELARDDANEDLARNSRLALGVLTSRQQIPGYWLTSYTDGPR